MSVRNNVGGDSLYLAIVLKGVSVFSFDSFFLLTLRYSQIQLLLMILLKQLKRGSLGAIIIFGSRIIGYAFIELTHGFLVLMLILNRIWGI
jgi:hypothetical protein